MAERVCVCRRGEKSGTGARAGEIRERSAFVLHLACSLQLKNNTGLLTEQRLPQSPLCAFSFPTTTPHFFSLALV